MSTRQSTLTQKHAALTQELIVEAAIAILQAGSVTEVSVRAVAAQAGMSERTVFRYFASREELLDAIAMEVVRRLDAPSVPSAPEDLTAYPAALFAQFEAKADLTRAALHTELYSRVRRHTSATRGEHLNAVINAAAPQAPEALRRLVGANIQYQLTASTWHYYRFNLSLSADDAVEAATLAIRHGLAGLAASI